MKRVICFLFVLGISASFVFADKNAFYENGKVRDTMFVNAEIGLRGRDYPSLNSNKVCVLYHRLAVKVVAIGKEETIDGITAPWVEILMPRYEWKSDKPEYCWVFGGYLSQEPAAPKIPQNAQELEQYLYSVGAWAEYQNNGKSRYSLCFNKNHDFYRGILDTDIGESGSWKAVSKDTVEFKTLYIIHEEEEHTWSLTFTFLEDGTFYDSCKSQKSHYYPYTDNPYFPSYYGYGKYGNVIQEMELNDHAWGVEWPIKHGISAKGTKFEEEYRKYWDPIMSRHQRAADKLE